MRIKISFELEMSDANLKAWAEEYDLGMAEVSNDARNYLAGLVQEAVKNQPHVREYASVKNYEVR